MPFGLVPYEGIRFWWGARAIFSLGRFDLVPDRKQVTQNDATDKEIQDLISWLDNIGLKAIRREVSSLIPSDDCRVEYNDDKYIIVANPRKSYGYLYIGAGPKKE